MRLFFFFQAEDGIRDVERSRGLGDVYKRQGLIDDLNKKNDELTKQVSNLTTQNADLTTKLSIAMANVTILTNLSNSLQITVNTQQAQIISLTNTNFWLMIGCGASGSLGIGGTITAILGYFQGGSLKDIRTNVDILTTLGNNQTSLIKNQAIAIQSQANVMQNVSDATNSTATDIVQLNRTATYIQTTTEAQTEIINQLRDKLTNLTRLFADENILVRQVLSYAQNISDITNSSSNTIASINNTIQLNIPLIKQQSDLITSQANAITNQLFALQNVLTQNVNLSMYINNTWNQSIDDALINMPTKQISYQTVFDTAVTGFNTTTFLTSVNNTNGTVTIVFTTQGYIMAGVLNVPWNLTGNLTQGFFINDPTSFLVSVNQGQICSVNSSNQSAFIKSNTMVQFGAGDIVVFDNQTGFSSANSSYIVKYYQPGVNSVNFYGGSSPFTAARVVVLKYTKLPKAGIASFIEKIIEKKEEKKFNLRPKRLWRQ
eukprot:TRINITY_DN5360_c0_g1_i12.p1 TRINITY_DN5360_c0_g1~~TRINITY_DN5360_c0_g1_i12.p1  ORF type:complete len:489 (-),score=90.98 TRINITY_DN5360_c0_g1_i12:117-1583(-)